MSIDVASRNLPPDISRRNGTIQLAYVPTPIHPQPKLQNPQNSQIFILWGNLAEMRGASFPMHVNIDISSGVYYTKQLNLTSVRRRLNASNDIVTFIEKKGEDILL